MKRNDLNSMNREQTMMSFLIKLAKKKKRKEEGQLTDFTRTI